MFKKELPIWYNNCLLLGQTVYIIVRIKHIFCFLTNTIKRTCAYLFGYFLCLPFLKRLQEIPQQTFTFWPSIYLSKKCVQNVVRRTRAFGPRSPATTGELSSRVVDPDPNDTEPGSDSRKTTHLRIRPEARLRIRVELNRIRPLKKRPGSDSRKTTQFRIRHIKIRNSTSNWKVLKYWYFAITLVCEYHRYIDGKYWK